MKTKYKFIHFVRCEPYGEWEIWATKSGENLGIVDYYREWKQFVFSTHNNLAVFNAGCLKDIIHFIEQLNEREGK